MAKYVVYGDPSFLTEAQRQYVTDRINELTELHGLVPSDRVRHMPPGITYFIHSQEGYPPYGVPGGDFPGVAYCYETDNRAAADEVAQRLTDAFYYPDELVSGSYGTWTDIND